MIAAQAYPLASGWFKRAVLYSDTRIMTRLRRHLTYANVCATLALFIAVSTGGAFAASQIDGRTIKKNSIPASALMNNSVTSAKIKNQQVTAADVKKGSLTPTVFTTNTQRQLASIGDGGGNGTTGGGGRGTTGPVTGACAQVGSSECSMTDVVPSGVGLPCRALGNTAQIGVWEQYADGTWACQWRSSTSGAYLGNPAKAGSLSGAVNA